MNSINSSRNTNMIKMLSQEETYSDDEKSVQSNR